MTDLQDAGSGMSAEDALIPTQRDIRSPSKAKNRQLKQKQKYYAYRAVHPSWVGQPYYTLVPVSEEPVSFRKSKKTNQHHPTAVIEVEHREILEAFLRRESWHLQASLNSTVEHAASEIRLRRSSKSLHPHHHHHHHRPNSVTPSGTDAETIEAPMALSPLEKTLATTSFALSNAQPDGSSVPADLRLKLKVRTWTKRDNFEQKEFFCGGPDIRHHRGRRNVREKMNEKWSLEHLGRKTRQKLVETHDMTDAAVEQEKSVHALSESVEKVTMAEHRSCRCIDDCACAPKSEACPAPPSEAEAPHQAQLLQPTPIMSPGVLSQLSDVDEPPTPTSTTSTSEMPSLLASFLASSEIVIVPRDHEDDTDSLRTDALSELDEGMFEIEWDLIDDSSSESAPVTGADSALC